MKMPVQLEQTGRHSPGWRAFTLIEVMVAMAVIGISVGALLTGVSSSVFNMRLARENLRATQIMLEKTETLRLFTWEQLNTLSFFTNGATKTRYLNDDSGRQYICSDFVQRYDPNNTNAQGLTYSGQIRFYDPRHYLINTSYATNNMKAVWIQLVWTNGGMNHTRSLTTLVSRNGLQNYVYGD